MPDASTGEAAVAEVVVRNPHGLHLRPATEFARIAQASGCTVRVETDEGQADGHSVLELAMLGVVQGTRLRISAAGAGAQALVQALADLVGDGTGAR